MDFLDLTLLYVEDDEKIQEQISQLLEKRVGKLLTATNGKDGLDLFKKEKPDIVITDIKMPLMDGLQMSAEIFKEKQNAQIIVTTAFTELNYLTTSIELGINNYTIKPIDKKQLMQTINRCAENIRLEKKEKELEKQLKESQNKFRLISSIVSEFFYSALYDKGEFKIDWVGGAIQKITGYSAEEFHSFQDFYNLLVEEEKFKFKQLVKRIQDNKVSSYEFRIQHLDKSERIVQVDAYPQWDNENEIVHSVVGVVQDISEKIRIKKQLEISEMRYRYLFQTIPIGLIFSKIDGSILDCNDAFLNLTGLTRSELKNMKMQDIYENPEDRDLLVDRLQNNDYVNYIKKYDTKLKHKSGKNIEASITATLSSDENPRSILAFMQESRSYRPVHDQEIKALKQELAESEKMKKMLVQVLQHEIGTPVNSIRNLTEILMLNLPDNPTVKHMQHHIESLSNQYLITSSLAGICSDPDLQKTQIHLYDNMEVLAKSLEGHIRDKNLNVMNKINSSLQVNVHSSVLDILRIFLFEAVKNSPENSSILLESHEITNAVKIAIYDYGEVYSTEKQISLNVAIKEIINTPEHLKIDTDIKVGKIIAELNGVHIWIDSLKDKGNVYYCQLPR